VALYSFKAKERASDKFSFEKVCGFITLSVHVCVVLLNLYSLFKL
jgi:hypothetical protein